MSRIENMFSFQVEIAVFQQFTLFHSGDTIFFTRKNFQHLLFPIKGQGGGGHLYPREKRLNQDKMHLKWFLYALCTLLCAFVYT